MTPVRISVENLTWGPSRSLTVLHDASFHAEPGELVAIVGPNGAGKSTLLRCLYRYHRPREGIVAIDGEDIWAMDAKAAARRIATVLQEQPSDFGMSVREIVALGRIPFRVPWGSGKVSRDAAIVARAIDEMELSELAERDVATLSGGERQRVMVARALVQEPGLIVLDEPTNHLDIRHQIELLERLRGLGSTVVASLHDLGLAAAHADRVVLLSAGHVVASGPPLAVLGRERIRDAFGVEALIDDHPLTARPRFSFSLPTPH